MINVSEEKNDKNGAYFKAKIGTRQWKNQILC